MVSIIVSIFISIIILYIGYLLRKINDLQIQINKQNQQILDLITVVHQHDKCILILGEEVFGKEEQILHNYSGIVGQA